MKKPIISKATKIFKSMQKKDYTLKEENQKVKEAKENVSNLGKYGKDLLLLINILKDYRKGKFQISKMDLAIIVAAIAYVALPADAMPDLIPFLGFLDDISIIGLALSKLSSLIIRYKNENLNNE